MVDDHGPRRMARDAIFDAFADRVVPRRINHQDTKAPRKINGRDRLGNFELLLGVLVSWWFKSLFQFDLVEIAPGPLACIIPASHGRWARGNFLLPVQEAPS